MNKQLEMLYRIKAESVMIIHDEELRVSVIDDLIERMEKLK